MDADKNQNNAYSLYNKNIENLKTNQNKKNNLIVNIPNASNINNNINNKLSNNNNNNFEMRYGTNSDLSDAYNNIEMINNKVGELKYNNKSYENLKYNRNDALYNEYNYADQEISIENINSLENLHINNDIYLRKYIDLKDNNLLRNYNNLLSKESLEKYNVNYIFDNNDGNNTGSSNSVTNSNSGNNNLKFNDKNNNNEREINYYSTENFSNIPQNIIYRDINNDCILHSEINYEQLNKLCYENSNNNIENNNAIKNPEGKDNTNLSNNLNTILSDIKQKKNFDFAHSSYYNNLNENNGENLKYPHIDSYNIKDTHDEKMNDCIINIEHVNDNFNTNNNIKNSDIENYDVNMKLGSGTNYEDTMKIENINGINSMNNINQMKEYDSNEQINNIDSNNSDDNNNNDNDKKKNEDNKLNEDKIFQHDASKEDYLNYLENKRDLQNLNNENYFNIDYYNQSGLYNNSIENITQDKFPEKLNNITQLHDINHATNGMNLNIGNLINNNNNNNSNINADEERSIINNDNFNDKIDIHENYNKYGGYVYKTCYSLIDNKLLNPDLYYSNSNDIKNNSLNTKDTNIIYKDKIDGIANISVIPDNTDQLETLNGININNKYSENEINMGINNYNNDEDNSTINHNNSDGNSSTTVAISSICDNDNAKEKNMNIEYNNLNNGNSEIVDDENICNINNEQTKIYPLSINLNNTHYIETNNNMAEYDSNSKLYKFSQFYKKIYIYNDEKENLMNIYNTFPNNISSDDKDSISVKCNDFNNIHCNPDLSKDNNSDNNNETFIKHMYVLSGNINILSNNEVQENNEHIQGSEMITNCIPQNENTGNIDKTSDSDNNNDNNTYSDDYDTEIEEMRLKKKEFKKMILNNESEFTTINENDELYKTVLYFEKKNKKILKMRKALRRKRKLKILMNEKNDNDDNINDPAKTIQPNIQNDEIPQWENNLMDKNGLHVENEENIDKSIKEIKKNMCVKQTYANNISENYKNDDSNNNINDISNSNSGMYPSYIIRTEKNDTEYIMPINNEIGKNEFYQNNEYIPNEALNGINMNYDQHEKEGCDFSHILKNNNNSNGSNNNDNILLNSCLNNIDDKNIENENYSNKGNNSINNYSSTNMNTINNNGNFENKNENLKESSFSNSNINKDIELCTYGIKRENTFSISGMNFQSNSNEVSNYMNSNNNNISNQLNGTDNQILRIKSEEILNNGEIEITKLNIEKKKPGRRRVREKKTKDQNDGNLIHDNQVGSNQVDVAIDGGSNEPKNGTIRKRRTRKNKNNNNIISNGFGIDSVENNGLNFEINNEINLQANNNNNEVILNAEYNNNTLNNCIHVKHELTNDHLNENNLITNPMLIYNGSNINGPELDQGLSNNINMDNIVPYENNIMINGDVNNNFINENMPTKRKKNVTRLNSTNQRTSNTPKRLIKREPNKSSNKNSNTNVNIEHENTIMCTEYLIKTDGIKIENFTNEDELRNQNSNIVKAEIKTKKQKKNLNVNILVKKEKSKKLVEKKVKVKICLEDYYKHSKEIYNNIDTLAKIDDSNIPSIEDGNFSGNLTDLLTKKENLICSNCLYAYKIQIAPKKNEKYNENNIPSKLNKVSFDDCSEEKDDIIIPMDENINKMGINTNGYTNDYTNDYPHIDYSVNKNDKIGNDDNNDETCNKTVNEYPKHGNYLDINTFNEIIDKNMAQENEYKITFYCLCGYNKYIYHNDEWKQVINCYYDEKNELKPKAPHIFCTKCKELLVTNRFLDKDKTKIIMVCDCGSRNYDRADSFWSRRGNIKQRKAPQILCEECNSKMWVHTWLDDIGSKVKLLCKCGFKNFLKKNNNWVRSPRWKKPVPLIICNSCQQKMYMSQWLSNDGTKVKMKCECGWKTLIKEGDTWVRSEWSKKLLCLKLVKNPDLLQKKYHAHLKKKNKPYDGNELLYFDENNNSKECNNNDEINPSLACDPMMKNNQDIFVTDIDNCTNANNNNDNNNNSSMIDNHTLSYSHNDIVNIRASGSIIGSEINNSNNIFQQNGQFLNNGIINHSIDIINNDSGFQVEIEENHKQNNMTINNSYDNIILENNKNNNSSNHINKDTNAGYNSIQNPVNNYLNCKTNYSNNNNSDVVFLEQNQDYYLSNNKDEANIALSEYNTGANNKKKNMALHENYKTNEPKKKNNKRKANNNNDNNKYWENENVDMIISNDNNTKKNQGTLLYKQNCKKKKNTGLKGKVNNPENILVGPSVPLDSVGSTIVSNPVGRECSLIYDENASNVQRFKSQQSSNNDILNRNISTNDNINNRQDMLEQSNDNSYGFYNIERPIDENNLNNNFNKIYCDNTNVNTINNNSTNDSNDNHRNNGEGNNNNSNTSGNNNDTNDNNSNGSTCYYVNNYYDHQNYEKSYFNHPYVISHFNENTFNNNNEINSNSTHDAYNNILNTTFNRTNNNFDMNYNTNLPPHHIDDKKYLGIESNEDLISTELDYDKKKYLLEQIEKLNFNISENDISNFLENSLIENLNGQTNDDKNKKEKMKKKMDSNDINVNYQNEVVQTNMNKNELYNENGDIMEYAKNITNIFANDKDKNDTNVTNKNDNTTNNNKKKNKGRNSKKRENTSKNENKGNVENDKTSSSSIVNENILVNSEQCTDGNDYLKKNEVDHNKNDFKDYFQFASSHNENPQYIESEYCNESTNLYNSILNLQAITEKLKNENSTSFKSHMSDVAQEKNNMDELFCAYNFNSDSEEKQCTHEVKYKINDFLTICTNCHEYINNNMDCNKIISSNVLPDSSDNSICKMNIHENDSEYKNMNNYDHIIKNKKNMNSYHDEHIYNSLKMDNNYSINFLDHQNICDTNYLGNNNCKNGNRNTTISNNNTKNCINNDSENASQCYNTSPNDATTPTNGKGSNDHIHIIENVEEFNHLYNQYCEYYLNNNTIDDNQIKTNYITNLFFQYQNDYAQNIDKCINNQMSPLESDKLYFTEENKYISDSTKYMSGEINSNEKIAYDEKNSNNNNSDDNYQDNYENYIETECNTNVCYNIIHT
ncbi:conserved Plasmodium protein, unknown function [Plasmodium yoelii]|uniref:Uncharacterized protein n=2 Tax=Plasmodium yoelii TaxID=5861 RepID=A0AAE9WXH5_PLAYO|nr:conserved Plasmodium protein, unknown function [Plasmodium yoelii]WBY60801.1 hypothetical protein Py17XNL_001401070 [Plasmodium yoelii yoelii]CDU20575.1 conserved Plasmodium protein, unknown function [Plasmodium yoelii]VTZ81536.1 conserved Plasmodium protein, unknown function [Plasmodium yoelii]|eukprot:XP_725279.2 conserved Plasmodium protein, unknown function [Plasmodium yoelii]